MTSAHPDPIDPTDPIHLVLTDGVAWMTLNRPHDGNAINLDLAAGILRSVASIAESETRVVVISGSGDDFCVGGDVIEMAGATDLSDHVRRLADTFHEALARLSELDAVVIAAVDGVAAGGGLGLALAADIQLASDRAMFMTAYEAIGLTPDSGTSFLLPHALGMPRARAMSASGIRLSAPDAAELGLVQDVVHPTELAVTARDLALRLAAKPQRHMSETRRLYRGADPGAYRSHLDAETRAISAAAASAEAAQLIGVLAARSARSVAARRLRASRQSVAGS